MSRVCLPSRAFNDRRVQGVHLRVLAAIAALGEGALSQHEIAAEGGMDDRNVRRYIAELRGFGYLSSDNVDGYASVYHIVFSPEHPGSELPPRVISTPGGNSTQASSPLDGPPPLSPAPLTPPPLNPPSRVPSSARATRLVDDWYPTSANIAYAESKGFAGADLDRQIEDFRDYWQAKSGQDATKLDWSKTWATWIRKATDWRARSPPKTTNGHAKQSPVTNLYEGAMRAADKLDRQEADRFAGIAPARSLLDRR